MAIYVRPTFLYTWAEIPRAPEDIADPELDTGHPAFPFVWDNGWEVPGQDVVKQPHQWVNFFYNYLDTYLKQWCYQPFLWESKITYAAQAVVIDEADGNAYIAEQPSLNVQPSTDDGTYWSLNNRLVAEEDDILQEIAERVALIDAHINDKSNPHETDWSKFVVPGLSQATIEDEFATLTGNLTDHVDGKLNPHNVTPAQADLIPKSGGTFQQQVQLDGGVVGFGVEGRVWRDTNGFYIGIQAGRVLRISTIAELSVDGVVSEIVHDGNTIKLHRKHNQKFKSAPTDIHLPLHQNLSAVVSSRAQGNGFADFEYTSDDTISYTNKSSVAVVAAINEPAFDAQGLILDAAVTQVLSTTNVMAAVGTVFAYVDGVPWYINRTTVESNLLDYLPPSATRVRDLKIWNKVLTSRQLAGLGI
jgi:hypothetical protein